MLCFFSMCLDQTNPNALQTESNEKSFSQMQVYDLLQLAQKQVCFQNYECTDTNYMLPAASEEAEEIEEPVGLAATGLAALSEALVIDSELKRRASIELPAE